MDPVASLRPDNIRDALLKDVEEPLDELRRVRTSLENASAAEEALDGQGELKNGSHI